MFGEKGFLAYKMCSVSDYDISKHEDFVKQTNGNLNHFNATSCKTFKGRSILVLDNQCVQSFGDGAFMGLKYPESEED